MNDLALPNYRHLEVVGSGAAAHMSLHQKSQCQRAKPTLEADNFRSPLFLSGDWLSDYVGDLRDGCAYLVSTASVRGHICGAFRVVNSLLQFYFNFFSSGLLRRIKIRKSHILFPVRVLMFLMSGIAIRHRPSRSFHGNAGFSG